MVLNVLDRFPFDLACGHEVIMGRLNELENVDL
jgi:hypothetical protein